MPLEVTSYAVPHVRRRSGGGNATPRLALPGRREEVLLHARVAGNADDERSEELPNACAVERSASCHANMFFLSSTLRAQQIPAFRGLRQENAESLEYVSPAQIPAQV